jgi:hypothetical protein
MTIDTSALRTRVQEEIDLIPEYKLPELYNLVHHFRLRIEVSGSENQPMMHFAGSWRDMLDEDFDEFIREIAERASHPRAQR